MKIIEQSYKILHMPDDILGTIEQCARTCYKSEDKIGCLGKTTDPSVAPCGRMGPDYTKCQRSECEDHSSQKFVKMIRDKGHHAMLEFGDITVKFITNRGVTHELVRHRIGVSYAQESTRYARHDGEMEFIKPVWALKAIFWHCGNTPILSELPEPEKIWVNAMLNAAADYRSLLANGWRPEQAREVLPNSLKTEIVVKANFRTWMHILTLRTSKKAHPQIRALMLPLLEELKTKIPAVFDDIG